MRTCTACINSFIRQSDMERSKLFCWYEHQINPYFRIGPLQLELLTMHPKTEVVIYHNLLGPTDLAFLRNDSGREFKISTSLAWFETNSKVRLSATATLSVQNSRQVQHILKLANRATGLSTLRRPLQIHSYQPGGHYSVHTDSVSVFCTAQTCSYSLQSACVSCTGAA